MGFEKKLKEIDAQSYCRNGQAIETRFIFSICLMNSERERRIFAHKCFMKPTIYQNMTVKHDELGNEERKHMKNDG